MPFRVLLTFIGNKGANTSVNRRRAERIWSDHYNSEIFLEREMLQWLVALLRIREIPGSGVDSEVVHPHGGFICLSQYSV